MNDVKDPAKIMKMSLFNTTFNLDGIWGGWAGPSSKTLLSHKVNSKHNIRFVSNQEMNDLIKKTRRHLDSKGFRDIRLNVMGGYSWAKANYRSEIAQAIINTY
jgi:hypothetical protein